ncbi:cytochrome oxidase c subunit VIb [Chloropicon roscoffensis]|uniref:Cytochrome oxidase c subunit VIb n=1 Tax=Chloropicon roscoffensis TaxID=1461544 RepID=A0AAX4P4I1_9CHLO
MATDEIKEFAKRKGRRACHEARDAFYKCLELSGLHDWRQGDAVPSSCAKTRKAYEGACPASWVVHFDQTYSHNKAVSQFLEQKVRVKQQG